ncbi:MAG TPA: hypothetical protein ENJ40_01255 [Thermosulfurimonas dismutans]|uniref:Basal-body rod modification protein FlgD n=1 Tax=Thermosulfurimonas dismutans TaxID=999894 RepID=A0A7C3CS85_9BACT|nr:hypothetical protein [Thermosulfurimonas dismutans]
MIAGVNPQTGQPLALKRTPKKTLSREDFILLFIKQLQFQDPMKPIENNEMAMQMALFSQVDQLFKLNEGFEKFMETVKTNQLATLSSLIGRIVKIKGDYGRVEKGRFLGAEFTLDQPAYQVQAVIQDARGREVRRLNLGNLSAGKHVLDWDATDNQGQKVPDGSYRLRLLSGGKPLKAEISVYGRVTSAELGETPRVTVNGEEKVKLSDLQEILYQI